MKPDADHTNPLGTDGFEFVEFTCAEPDALKGLFEQMGFVAVARHRSKAVLRFVQGDINFLLNMEPSGQPAAFREQHGPSANAMAFRVRDARVALEMAVARGATAIEGPVGPMELNIPAIAGIGGSNLYLVDRYGADAIYDVDFVPIPGAVAGIGVGLTYLDHLTHNVFRGQIETWAGFYERVFNFREVSHFDIEGTQTGLISKAMTSPCGKIRIPVNESRDEHSQIAEYLRDYGGEGIQHIAFGSDDICASVEAMRARGLRFQTIPATYYEALPGRIADHGQDLARLAANSILMDGDPAGGRGLLLQIFTENMIGPIFFEVIQRMGNQGFGEGNVKALFESVELDQVRRGVLPPAG